MGLTRLLLIVAGLYLVWRVLSSLGRKLQNRGAGAEDFSRFSARRRGRKSEREGAAETLLECAGCGTFVPSSRMLPGHDSRFFCSEVCRRRVELKGGEGTSRR